MEREVTTSRGAGDAWWDRGPQYSGHQSHRRAVTLVGMNPTARSLPLNRKERFYTGTVLPMLVCADNFRHLGSFLSLCGLRDCRAGEDVQFFTEYGFAESVYTETDKQTWPTGLKHDTPDVVIRSGDWLLTVEAKMFHNPTAAALDRQMKAQKPLVDLWVERLGVSQHQHVLLLPRRLAEQADLAAAWPVVTWEAVLDLYRGIADPYWVKVLDEALAQYDALVSTGPGFGQNMDARMTGFDIVTGWPDHGYLTMGRQGGLVGALLKTDIDSGSWRTHSYEVSKQPTAANANWFTIEEFRDRLRPA